MNPSTLSTLSLPVLLNLQADVSQELAKREACERAEALTQIRAIALKTGLPLKDLFKGTGARTSKAKVASARKGKPAYRTP